MKRFQDSFMTQEQIEMNLSLQNKEFVLSDSVIDNLDICIIPHFGYITCVEIISKGWPILWHRNNLPNAGYVIRTLTCLLDAAKEDGTRLSDIQNVPCRIFYCDRKAEAIGHPHRDSFIMLEDLARADIPKETN